LNLSAMVAPAPGAAAQYYPAQYWYALLELPRANEFPGTGENANGIATAMRSQGEWIRNIVGTDGCTVAIKWATERRAKFPKRWAHSRIRLRLGNGESSPDRPVMV